MKTLDNSIFKLSELDNTNIYGGDTCDVSVEHYITHFNCGGTSQDVKAVDYCLFT